MGQIEPLMPMGRNQFEQLAPMEVALLDQFSSRFSKLQDAMGAKLFPQILELLGEQGAMLTFIDKLNRLEKIGVLCSSSDWLLLREMRNAFAHDYPEDSELNAATLNRAQPLADQLLLTYQQVRAVAVRYGAVVPG